MRAGSDDNGGVDAALLTILCALAAGYALDRMHLPGGISDIPMIAADMGADPSVLLTFAVAAVCGLIGKVSPMPSGTMGCFVIVFLLCAAGSFSRREGMLAATPAGASDMALISADLGVSNVKLIALQVMRLVVVVLAFPSILSLVVKMFA